MGDGTGSIGAGSAEAAVKRAIPPEAIPERLVAVIERARFSWLVNRTEKPVAQDYDAALAALRAEFKYYRNASRALRRCADLIQDMAERCEEEMAAITELAAS